MYRAIEDKGIYVAELPASSAGGEGLIAEIERHRAIAFPRASFPQSCPECGGELSQEVAAYFVAAPGDETLGIITTHAWFCMDCPVLVMDADRFDQLLDAILPGARTVGIAGCIEVSAIDADRMENLGEEDDPVPFAAFRSFERREGEKRRLDLSASRISRNGRCRCGSGRKHKRCCGRGRRAS